MSLDLFLKQLHVVHITVFLPMQYIRLLLFYSAIFQSVIFQTCKFQFCKFSYPFCNIRLVENNISAMIRYISINFGRDMQNSTSF